jgi:hypothetical protein
LQFLSFWPPAALIAPIIRPEPCRPRRRREGAEDAPLPSPAATNLLGPRCQSSGTGPTRSYSGKGARSAPDPRRPRHGWPGLVDSGVLEVPLHVDRLGHAGQHPQPTAAVRAEEHVRRGGPHVCPWTPRSGPACVRACTTPMWRPCCRRRP